MIDKFGNAFYLIIYLAHFIIVGSYAYQLVFDTKKFLKGRGVDKTATLITRFAGSFMPTTATTSSRQMAMTLRFDWEFFDDM